MIAKSKGFKRLKRGLKKIEPPLRKWWEELEAVDAAFDKITSPLKIYVDDVEVTDNTQVFLDFGNSESRTAHVLSLMHKGEVRHIDLNLCK